MLKCIQCTFSCGFRTVIMSISYFTVVMPSEVLRYVERCLALHWMAPDCSVVGDSVASCFLLSFLVSCHFSVYQFLKQSCFMSPTLLRQWELAWCPDGSFIPASGVIICMEFVTAILFSAYIWVYGCYMVYEMRGGALEVCQNVCNMFTLRFIYI